MPLTTEDHMLLVDCFAPDPHDRPVISEFVAGATYARGSAVAYLTDPDTGIPNGDAIASVIVDPDEDETLAELFAWRARVSDETYAAEYRGSAGWKAAVSIAGEALVRLDVELTAPIPYSQRFLLLASVNAGMLRAVNRGALTFLVTEHLARNGAHLGAYQVLTDSLTAGQVTHPPSTALTQALAQIGPHSAEKWPPQTRAQV